MSHVFGFCGHFFPFLALRAIFGRKIAAKSPQIACFAYVISRIFTNLSAFLRLFCGYLT